PAFPANSLAAEPIVAAAPELRPRLVPRGQVLLSDHARGRRDAMPLHAGVGGESLERELRRALARGAGLRRPARPESLRTLRAAIPAGRVDVPRRRHRLLAHRALSPTRGLSRARPAARLVRRRRTDRRGRPPAPLPPASMVRALGALAARLHAHPRRARRDPG